MDSHSTALPAAPETNHDAHAEAHPHPKYFKIWFWLLVLTVLEVIVAQRIPKPAMYWLLGGMALYKAGLVGAYFMHLKFERPTMWIIALAPLIFGVIFAIGAYPDSEKGTGAFKRGVLDPWSGKSTEGVSPSSANPVKHE